MKTILVLTDFSDNAKNAAKAATYLASIINADVLLFNTILQVAEIPAYTEGAFFATGLQKWEQSSKESLEELKNELNTFLDTYQFKEGKTRPLVITKFGEGDLSENVKNISSQNNVCMVVMGGRSASTIDHLLFGSDTTRVIEHALKPVLVVPHNARLNSFTNILFATNYEPADIQALNYFEELSTSLPFKLSVVHINLPDDNTENLDLDELIIARKLENMTNINPVFKEIKGRKLEASLQRICDTNATDILAIAHRPAGIFSQIFSLSTTLNALKHQTLPLLIFPPRIKNN